MVSAIEVLEANKALYRTEMLGALAEIMEPLEVEDGHIFMKEGDECCSIIFIETGKIVRTKLSVSDEEKEGILKLGIDKIKENSIVVEEIVGGTRSTGLFHNFDSGQTAFATMSASGPTKVWSVSGDKFRELVSKPEYSLLLDDASYGEKDSYGIEKISKPCRIYRWQIEQPKTYQMSIVRRNKLGGRKFQCCPR